MLSDLIKDIKMIKCNKCNDTGKIKFSDFDLQSDSYEDITRYCDCETGKEESKKLFSDLDLFFT